jgi:hypothetical protein
VKDLLYTLGMQRYGIKLVDSQFHIEGFPEAVKLISTASLVAHLPQQLADMILHHADLRFARECLETLSSPQVNSPLVAEALWRCAIVHYCKCFGKHGSRRVNLSYSKFLPVGLPRDIHKYFLNLRNKHLLHDDNAWNQATPMAVVGPAGRNEKIQKVLCVKISGETRNTSNINNLQLLISHALPWVESCVDDLCNKIKIELESHSYDVLLAQHEPEPYYAPVAEDMSKSRR